MITINDLKNLADVAGNCLTIYQPLRGEHSVGTNPETCLLAAIHKAGQILEAKGFAEADREDMLRPLGKIAVNTDWSARRGSVVLFRAPGFTMVKFWPDQLPSRVHFAPEFLVLPLLPGLLRHRDFWLLALSIKAVKLYRCSTDAMVETELPKGLATSLALDEAFDQPDHSLRGRASAGPSVGAMKGVQFGTSSARELEVNYLHDFFKAIDRGIHPLLVADPQPLILAGVQREVAIYRKLNSYSPLLAEAVLGSPSALGLKVLFDKASQFLPAFSERPIAKTVRQMEDAASRGLLAWEPTAVIEAARLHRIEELILSPATPGYDQHEVAVNWATLATIRSSGTVSMLNAPQTPAGIAAILRFHPVAPEIGDPTPGHLGESAYKLRTGHGASRMIA